LPHLISLDHEFGHSNWQFLRPNLKVSPFAAVVAVVEHVALQPAPVHCAFSVGMNNALNRAAEGFKMSKCKKG
jgi:hypothetical protein